METAVAVVGLFIAALLEHESIRKDRVALCTRAVHIHRQPLLAYIGVDVGGVAAAPALII